MKVTTDRSIRTVGIRSALLDFPKESGHEVKDYRDFSYSAGERYPSEE